MKEVSERILWVKLKLDRKVWVFVSAYGPGNEKSEREREMFWNKLNECLEGFDVNMNVIVLGDLNARVGNEAIEKVMGTFGVPGRNGNGEKLLNLCCERELMIENSFFKKREIHKFT